MMKISLFILALLFIYGTPALSQTNIRIVDFKNFKYRLSCGSADKVSTVTLRDGQYEGSKGSIDQVYLQITDVLYGDLDGDRRDEAVVLYSCGSGASYVYIWGLVFTQKRNKLILITDIEGGNKTDGGFHDVRILKGALIVERYELGIAGVGPENIVRTRFKLKGNQVVQVGKQTSRPFQNK